MVPEYLYFQVGNSKKKTKGNEQEENFTYPETDEEEEEEEEEKKEVVRSTKKKQKTKKEVERKINLRKRNYIDDLKFSSDDSCEEAQRHRALEVKLID